jgi:PKD domain-containing protein
MRLRGTPLLLSILCLGAILVASVACDKVSPTAPAGTTITLSANPGRIASATGTSTIRAIVVKSNGQPVNRGTIVNFDTNLGTIDASATTDDSGIAQATLHGDGRVGMATVHASTGAIAPVMLMIQIGTAAASITLQANPSGIDSSGGTINLVALVRDDSGQPLPNAQVNFGTDVGTLASGGGIVRTDGNGQATDKLVVKASELTNNLSSFTVRANVAGANGSLSSTTFTIQVRTGRPVADFNSTNLGNFKVQFINLSTGQNLTFQWNFGDGGFSTEANPTHQFTGSGPFQVQLTATNSVTGEASVKVKSVNPS